MPNFGHAKWSRSWRIAWLPHGRLSYDTDSTESEWWRWRISVASNESMTQHFSRTKCDPKWIHGWPKAMMFRWVCLTMFNPKCMMFRNPLWGSHFSNDFDTSPRGPSRPNWEAPPAPAPIVEAPWMGCFLASIHWEIKSPSKSMATHTHTHVICVWVYIYYIHTCMYIYILYI